MELETVILENKKRYLVIPAYEPDEKLLNLLQNAYDAQLFEIIVVNDGSYKEYDGIFDEAKNYATVLNHLFNTP